MEKDKLIFDIIEREHQRQKKGIELIASENFVSDDVMRAMGSCLTNKYAEGYPGHRYYGGCQVVDEAETIAIERLKQIFGAEWANVQPHSGAQANMAVYAAPEIAPAGIVHHLFVHLSREGNVVRRAVGAAELQRRNHPFTIGHDIHLLNGARP